MSPGTHGGQKGLTLLETIVASSLLLLVLGGVLGVLRSGTDTYAVGITKADVDSHARNLVDTIAEALVYSGNAVMLPASASPLSSSTITYQESTGFSGGVLRWGNPLTIEFVIDAGELDDDRDNDGNGLVDEGMVVRRETLPSGETREVVLTRWVREYLEGEVPNGADDNGNGLVDERGLCFERNGDVWTVRATIERRDADGRLLTCTADTTVRPRN